MAHRLFIAETRDLAELNARRSNLWSTDHGNEVRWMNGDTGEGLQYARGVRIDVIHMFGTLEQCLTWRNKLTSEWDEQLKPGCKYASVVIHTPKMWDTTTVPKES